MKNTSHFSRSSKMYVAVHLIAINRGSNTKVKKKRKKNKRTKKKTTNSVTRRSVVRVIVDIKNVVKVGKGLVKKQKRHKSVTLE